MSRLQEIDHLLGRCAEELRPRDNGVPDVARIRLLMDDLLDERIRIAGVKEFKTPTSKVCPSGHSLDTDTQKAMAAAKRKP